jgi:hypothetical protein
MRRGCPDVALCDGGQALEFAVAIGGTADAEGRAAMGTLDAIDPQRTNAAAMQQFFGTSAALSGSVLCAGVSVARAT